MSESKLATVITPWPDHTVIGGVLFRAGAALRVSDVVGLILNANDNESPALIPAGFSIRLGTGVRNGGLVIQAAPTGRAFVCENGELLVPDGNEGGRWIPGGREVEEGLLWYDTDGTLAERVQRAMARYRQKYGADPATCYVNPADWGGETQVEGIEIKTRLNVLPGHVWAIRQVPPGVIEVREHLNSER